MRWSIPCTLGSQQFVVFVSNVFDMSPTVVNQTDCTMLSHCIYPTTILVIDDHDALNFQGFNGLLQHR